MTESLLHMFFGCLGGSVNVYIDAWDNLLFILGLGGVCLLAVVCLSLSCLAYKIRRNEKRKTQAKELQLTRLKSHSVLGKKDKINDSKYNEHATNVKLPDLQATVSLPNAVDVNQVNTKVDGEDDDSITSDEIEDETEGKAMNDVNQLLSNDSVFDNVEIVYNDNAGSRTNHDRHDNCNADADNGDVVFNDSEFEFVNWLKITFDNNNIDAATRKTFMAEFATKNVNGKKLSQFRNNENMLTQFISTFQFKYQTFQIWNMIKSSLNALK